MGASYWQRRAGWRDRWVGAARPRAVEFAILGGGFAGLATALRLRERHPAASIAVFEAERVGFGASGRNAGFLSPLPAPIWVLGAEGDPAFAWGAAAIHREVHAVARWIAEVAPRSELAPATLALQAQGRASDLALGEMIRAVAHVGLPHEVVTSRVHPGARALLMEGYTVDPYALVGDLAEHAAARGVAIHERSPVRAVEGLRAGGARVVLDDGVVEAGKVVACTNAYTSSIALGERVGALVVHTFMAATPPVDVAAVPRDGDFTVEVGAAQGYHRRHAGRVLYGALDELRTPPGDEFAVPPRHRAALAAALPRRAGGVALAIDEAWGGRFHATPTGLPIIRTSDANHALVLNVGYGGTGVALTLACARLAACVASNGAFTAEDDARLLALIHATRLPVRAGLRAAARIARGWATSWLR